MVSNQGRSLSSAASFGCSLPLSLSSPLPTLSLDNDDDDFQVPPSQITETSQLKLLRPSNCIAAPRRTSKKQKRCENPGKQNALSRLDQGSLGDSDRYDLSSQRYSLECIRSSIDCSLSVSDSTGQNGDSEFSPGCEEKLDAKAAYLCNSIEGRLLKQRLAVEPGIAPRETDGIAKKSIEFDGLLNLCSEALAQEDAFNGSGLVCCPLCGTDFSSFSEEQRQVHTNLCLDEAENQVQVHINRDKEEASYSCQEEVVDDPAQIPQKGDISPVLNWLRNLGLDKYENVFVREEIDWTTLQWLTEEDLLSIGVAALGPRKKIVHALSELRKSSTYVKEGQTKHILQRSNAEESPTEKPFSRTNARKPEANKLITEFFPGSDRKRVIKKIENQPPSIKVFSDSSSRRASKENARNRKLKDIPPWCCIPGTSFRVDAFKYLRGDCSHWFLTHFHMDHYQGLTRSFRHGKVYCSSITAKLVNMKIGIPWERLEVLPLNQSVHIAGVAVTCFDANHCLGSILILFELPNGEAVLHTGDFRYSEEMASALNGYAINTLLLDTTYCNPQYDFPKQEAVIQFVIESIQAEAFNPKTLFLIGSYTIGKERLFMEVARFLREKVYINAAKLRMLECLGFPKEDMQWFTVNENESNIHVVPMWTIASFKRLKYVVNQYAGRYSLIVAFSPTGWTFGKGKKKSPGRRWQQGTIIRYEVPYSEHSSFTELKEFVKRLSPKNIIPTVNNDGPDSVAAMLSLLLQ